MKKVMIIALILVGALFIPTVSAEVLYDEHLEYYVFTGGNGTGTYGGSSYFGGGSYGGLVIPDITKVGDLSYVVVELPASTIHSEGTQQFTYVIDGKTKTARMHTAYIRNIFQQHIKTRYTFFFDDWDNIGMTGSRTISTPQMFSTSKNCESHPRNGDSSIWVAGNAEATYTIVSSTGMHFQNDIKISSLDAGNTIAVSLKRIINSQTFPSTLMAYNNDTEIYSSYGIIDDDVRFLSRGITEIKLGTPLDTYVFPLTKPEQIDENQVTIYVRNSQTGALLANAHINISASVNGTLQEVINETIPSGTATYTLQPTGGGMPNPDYYRLITSLEGYNSIMPYIDFEHGSATTLIVEMEPTTGGPADDNMTFIEFYVRDIYTNPISGASVTCGGYTLITNSAGYTQFEMPVNSAYSYKVSKTGYLTIEGIATVESDDRYVVNVALMAGVVPTQTVVTPTITVEPTPTQTTPPIQEDNLIGLSVKGLAKGFGIDYDTALLLFGLMIIFGAGGIVMSSVNGGAMEFIAGSIVGTFVAFALGLIPIWIFIIIAVVFGAYVLRVFIQGGQ